VNTLDGAGGSFYFVDPQDDMLGYLHGAGADAGGRIQLR